MGRPFAAQADTRCDPVSYDPERPIEPAAFALPDPAVRLLRDVVETTTSEYEELGYFQFDAFLRGTVERLRSMVACDRAYAEAVAGMLYLVSAEHLKAGRCAPEMFWVRLLGEFAEQTHVVIRVVGQGPGEVVLKAAGADDEVACEHGRVVAFMGRAYHDANAKG